MAEVSPDELEVWLEWAAAKLIAMPAGRLKPAEPRAYWPDYSQDSHQVLEFRSNLRIRALAPSSNEIPIIDEIIFLPCLIHSESKRRIVQWRAQIHPIRRTHLLKWDWIAAKLEIKIYTTKRWHKEALVELSRKIPPETVCRIMAFRETAAEFT